MTTKVAARARGSVRAASRSRASRGSPVRRLVENDERLIQTSSAHVGKRCDLDLAALLGPREPLRRHELVERVVERAEIGIDLLLKVTGQESEPLARFDSGAREDEPADLSIAERRHAHRDGEIALPGAGGADPEDQAVLADPPAGRPPIL